MALGGETSKDPRFGVGLNASRVRLGVLLLISWLCLSARLDLRAPLSLAMHVGWCAAVSADVTLRLLVSVPGGVTASWTLPPRLVATGCAATEKGAYIYAPPTHILREGGICVRSAT